jgi:hypothetical protein
MEKPFIKVNCFNCKREFFKSEGQIKYYPRHFCCLDCWYNWRGDRKNELKSKKMA